MQPKLLRVLQEQEFERLGSTKTNKVDVRLVAATNRDLARMVADGRFRADLYYRLNVFQLVLPPLRERRDDIPQLVRHFTQHFARRMGRRIETIPSAVLDALVGYSWPGNIRELQNVIERAVILSSGPALQVPLGDLQPTSPSPLPSPLRPLRGRRIGGEGAGPGTSRGGDAGRGRAGALFRRPSRDRLGGGRAEGGRGAPGDEALDLARENEKTRHLPAPVVPARRQRYGPGGTSYLALPVLAANRLAPSDPQVPLNAAFTPAAPWAVWTGPVAANGGLRRFFVAGRVHGAYIRGTVPGFRSASASSATPRITASPQMKFTTLLPMRFNDGREVPAEQISRILDELALQFGGCSDEGITKGQWLDPKDRTLYRDESRRVSVSCDNRLLFEAQQAVVRIGRELGQGAMYFEVRDYDGVQILEVPAERQET
jgi:hypothetical protein